MGHGIEIRSDRVTCHIFPQSELQCMTVALEQVALDNITQRDQRHFIVWNFDTHIAMTRNRRLDADARGSQGERQVISQRGDFVYTHLSASVSSLDEERFHAKLRDRRSAID